MSNLSLFSESELEIPPQFCKLKYPSKGFKERLAALRKMKLPEQLDLFMQRLKKPLVKLSNRSTKRGQGEWEDAKTFQGSITITERPRTVDIAALAGFDWSSEEIRALHSNLFLESMEALQAEGNPDEKLDILDWVFSPTFIDKMGKTYDGRPCLIRRHAKDIPFSFWNCCLAVGIYDPDEYRAGMIKYMDGDIRQKLEKFMLILTGANHN